MDERNEIIVTGREGINIYPGMPASKQLKLMGCYIICRDAMQTNDLHQNEEYCTPEMKRIVDKICLKFSVPLLYLPGDFNN